MAANVDRVAEHNLSVLERVIGTGDLSKLTSEERTAYIFQVCKSLDLNPTTRPFEYISFKGKLTLYARKDCTEQLRRRDNISLQVVSEIETRGVYVVRVKATLPNGRYDESTGAVATAGLSGEDLANAFMRAETKAKRRATLSICGMGFLDETEVEGGDAIPVQRIASPPRPERTPVKAIPHATNGGDKKDPQTGAELDAWMDKLEGWAMGQGLCALSEIRAHVIRHPEVKSIGPVVSWSSDQVAAAVRVARAFVVEKKRKAEEKAKAGPVDLAGDPAELANQEQMDEIADLVKQTGKDWHDYQAPSGGGLQNLLAKDFKAARASLMVQLENAP